MQTAPPAPATAPIARPAAAAPPLPSEIRLRHKRLPIEKRARSVPHKAKFVMAIVATSLFYLTLIGTAAALFAFVIVPSTSAAALLIGFGGISTFLWLFSFFKRRSCHCPLCHGTPFLDCAAHKHAKAVRFYPLNYGNSNVFRCIVRQHFRCQYCGTPFDLLKPR